MTLRHDSISYKPYVEGTLLAARLLDPGFAVPDAVAEEAALRAALDRHQGNKSRAAAELGIAGRGPATEQAASAGSAAAAS